MSERVAPHDLTAERAVLGAVLIEPEMLDVAEASGLRAVHFFRAAHRQIWEGFARVRATGETIGVFVIAGNVRGVLDGSQSPVLERSDVVVVPMPGVEGASHSF